MVFFFIVLCSKRYFKKGKMILRGLKCNGLGKFLNELEEIEIRSEKGRGDKKS